MRTHRCVFRILLCFRLNSHGAVASDSRAEIARRVACVRARAPRHVFLTCTLLAGYFISHFVTPNAPPKSLTPSRISTSLLQYLFCFSISFKMEIDMPSTLVTLQKEFKELKWKYFCGDDYKIGCLFIFIYY